MINLERRKAVLLATAALAMPYVSRANALPTAEYCLGFDASSSMYVGTTQHYQVQREGHVLALQDPTVTAALVEQQAVLRAIVWADQNTAHEMVPSVHVTTAADVRQFANTINAAHPEVKQGSATHHSDPVECALALPRMAANLVIDISTDQDIQGADRTNTQIARQRALDAGALINVLAIGVDAEEYMNLSLNLQAGEGSFTLSIADFSHYLEAIRLKLLRETMAFV